MNNIMESSYKNIVYISSTSHLFFGAYLPGFMKSIMENVKWQLF